jgi:CheY-like chemotaxis protein
LRVLIVDDNATNRQIVEHQLSAWGVVSNSVASGVEALAALRTGLGGLRYHVAIIDFHMPEMDGLMLAHAISEDPAIADTRLVMMSSLGGRSDTGRNTAAIEIWLAKPIRHAQMLDSLARMVSTDLAGSHHKPVVGPALGESRIRLMRQGLRILIAEDSVMTQRVTQHQLRKLGYPFPADTVADGREALAAMARTPYPIILMDCQMPEMSGYEATAELRRREDGKSHTVVIATTANALESDREKCLAAGMDDYVAKPIKLPELAAVLDRWLGAACELADQIADRSPARSAETATSSIK